MTTERLQLELDVILPNTFDAADACVERLMQELNGRSGIERSHIQPANPARLCIHYDPKVISLSRLREIVASTGAQLTQRYGHMLLEVDGLSNERRARTVSERLSALVGVVEAQATAAGFVRVEFDRTLESEKDVRQALEEMGVTVRASRGDVVAAKLVESAAIAKEERAAAEHELEHEASWFGRNAELYFSLLCGLMLGVGYLAERTGFGPGWTSLTCYALAYLFGGFYTVREAIDSLRLKRLEIDTLMLVAAAGAALLGKWAEGALLLFLFSLGHSLEHYALGRARRAIEALAKLAPKTAEVRRNGVVQEIPVEQLIVSDTVLVRPNVRIPADGFVVAGTSSVDQSAVTGESVPVDKQPVTDPARAAANPEKLSAEHRVFAGTINGSGALEIQVFRLTEDSTLARVVRMISEAETQKSPTQLFTDRIERVFVPSVLALVSLLLFAFVVLDEPFRDSFYRAMAVLVAASPCALAIATPSAVLAAVARAARGGVLVKGGGPLERLGALGAIAFDKTGTLTEGKPRVTDVVSVGDATEEELLSVAIAVERSSDHPLASAVVRDGQARLQPNAVILEARDVRSITGRGISAQIDGEQVAIGKPELFGEIDGPPLSGEIKQSIERLEEQGRTLMVVRRGQRYLGVLGLMDTPRAPARAVIARLRELGIRRMIMISGDNKRVAEAVANEVGLDEAWGDLMPEHKVDSIKRLRSEQHVAMVGDGVNDAPAMANATVGIAMGAAGSDVALEAADVALMGDDLRNLPFVVGLSRRTNAVIRQNLFMSLGVVALLIPATIFGLQIGFAVIAHEGSTLVVVANALRLLAYRSNDSRTA